MSFKNIKPKLKKGISIGSIILTLAGTGCGNEHKNVKGTNTLISYNMPDETSNAYKITATTSNDTVNSVIYLKNPGDTFYSSISMNKIDGRNYELTIPITDSTTLETYVKAVNMDGSVTQTNPITTKVYLSEQHGQEVIENTVNNFVFNDIPTSKGIDIIDIINSTNIEVDVALYFEGNLTYNGVPGNKALIFLNYVSKSDDPVNAENDMAVLNSEPYFNGIGIPNVYMNFDNLGTQTNRQDIENIVNTILTNEDFFLVYIIN